MPTTKFLSLGEFKKRTILEAMREEFLDIPYGEIRVSSLIQRAGISRASFYLYFEGKEDILGCMLNQIYERLAENIEEAFRRKQGRFHDSMMYLAREILTEKDYRNGWKLYRRIMENPECRTIAEAVEKDFCTGEIWQRTMQGCHEEMSRSQSPGPGREELRCAIDMGLLVIFRAAKAYMAGYRDLHELQRTVSRQLMILETGI